MAGTIVVKNQNEKDFAQVITGIDRRGISTVFVIIRKLMEKVE